MRARFVARSLVAAAAIVAIGGSATGCTTGRSDSPRASSTVVAQPSKSSAPDATTDSTPTSTPSPTAAADVHIEPPDGDGWVGWGRVLVSGVVQPFDSGREVIQNGTPSVYVYVPGDGPHTIRLSADLGAGEVQRQLMNFTGPDGDLLLVVASTTLIPSVGLTPQSVDMRLDSYSVNTGAVVATYDLGTTEKTDRVIAALGASMSDVVAVDTFHPGDPGGPVGINMRTGTQVWAAGPGTELGDQTIAGTANGTVVLEKTTKKMSDQDEPCVVESGINTETGKQIWQVNASDFPNKKYEGCGSVSLYTIDEHGHEDGPSSFGALFGVHIGYAGYNVPDDCRAFEGATGAALAYDVCEGIYRYDPINKLAVDRSGNDMIADPNMPIKVFDVATGNALYTVTMEQVNSLDLKANDIHGGYLYTQTSDGTPIVDVTSGQVVTNNATITPAMTVGAYTLYSDGTLSLNPRLSANGG